MMMSSCSGVQLLLEKKCDLDLCDEVNGNTPLMLATSLNQVDSSVQK